MLSCHTENFDYEHQNYRCSRHETNASPRSINKIDQYVLCARICTTSCSVQRKKYMTLHFVTCRLTACWNLPFSTDKRYLIMLVLKTFCFAYITVGITKAVFYENVFPSDIKLGISVTKIVGVSRSPVRTCEWRERILRSQFSGAFHGLDLSVA